jgi:AraC family transcriptional regulator
MDADTRIRLLGIGTVRSSADIGWRSIYFEQRKGDSFETIEHVIDGHYLMVKLNPLSKAERKLDGKIQVEIQRRGATVYIPDGCTHRVRYTTSLGRLHLMVLPKAVVDCVADELGIAQFDGIPKFAQGEDRFVLEIAEALDQELADGNPHGELFAQTYARVLAAHIVTRYNHSNAYRTKLPALNATKLRRLDHYIETMLSHAISLSELAGQVGLSECYFCRVFKQATGMSPYKYVLQKRLEFAATCLTECDMSIQDIAFASGFGDAVQFTKHFRRANGLTPSAYRVTYAKKKAYAMAASFDGVHGNGMYRSSSVEGIALSAESS